MSTDPILLKSSFTIPSPLGWETQAPKTLDPTIPTMQLNSVCHLTLLPKGAAEVIYQFAFTGCVYFYL